MRDPTSIPILDCWESGHRPSDRLMLDLTTPILMGWAKGMWGSSCSGSFGCVFVVVVTCLLILPSGSLVALRHLVSIYLRHGLFKFSIVSHPLRGRAMIQAGMRLELPGRKLWCFDHGRGAEDWDLNQGILISRGEALRCHGIFWTVGLCEKERDWSVHQFINAWLPLILVPFFLSERLVVGFEVRAERQLQAQQQEEVIPVQVGLLAGLQKSWIDLNSLVMSHVPSFPFISGCIHASLRSIFHIVWNGFGHQLAIQGWEFPLGTRLAFGSSIEALLVGRMAWLTDRFFQKSSLDLRKNMISK